MPWRTDFDSQEAFFCVQTKHAEKWIFHCEKSGKNIRVGFYGCPRRLLQLTLNDVRCFKGTGSQTKFAQKARCLIAKWLAWVSDFFLSGEFQMTKKKCPINDDFLFRSQLCINTAIVYMHRFYAFHSFSHFNRHGIGAASLFLAAKVRVL